MPAQLCSRGERGVRGLRGDERGTSSTAAPAGGPPSLQRQEVKGTSKLKGNGGVRGCPLLCCRRRCAGMMGRRGGGRVGPAVRPGGAQSPVCVRFRVLIYRWGTMVNSEGEGSACIICVFRTP